MNNVSLNEYILEGLGEIHALLAHEIMVFFKKRPERFTFQRISNRSFKVNLSSGRVEVAYSYDIKHDVWIVQINKSIIHIQNGRFKTVSQISEEIIESLLS